MAITKRHTPNLPKAQNVQTQCHSDLQKTPPSASTWTNHLHLLTAASKGEQFMKRAT